MRAVLLWLIGALLTLVIAPSVLVIRGLTFPWDSRRACPHALGRVWARAILGCIPGWRLRASGLEHARGGPFVIVANHESTLDILAVYAVPLPFKWLAKAAIFRVPVMGWAMRACGYVAVVRGERESVAQAMRDSEAWLRRGVSMLYFPEGTRSPDGALRPFKSGAFDLAIRTGTPLLPVTVAGTRAALPRGDWRLRAPATFRVHVDAPVPVAGCGPADRDRLMAELHACIAARKAELDSPSPPAK